MVISSKSRVSEGEKIMSACSSSSTLSACPFSTSEHAHLCLNGSKMVLMFSNPEDAPYQPSLQSIIGVVNGSSTEGGSSEDTDIKSPDGNELALVPFEFAGNSTSERSEEVVKMRARKAKVKSSVFSLREVMSRATSLILGSFKSNHDGVKCSRNGSDEKKSAINYCVGSVITDGFELNRENKRKRTYRRDKKKVSRERCSLYNLSVWAKTVLGFTTARPEKNKNRRPKSTSTKHRRNSCSERQLTVIKSSTEDSSFQYCYYFTCLGQEKLNKLLNRTPSQEKLDTIHYLTSQAPRAVSQAMKATNPRSMVDAARLQVLYEDLTARAIGDYAHAHWKLDDILKELTKKIDERSLKNLESHLKRKINNP